MDNNESLSLSSMNTLILWNVSKAVERNPDIDLKAALRAAQERLDKNSHDVKAIISQYPEERHLACALLAWQQIGHKDSESLYRFITEKASNMPNETLSKEESIIDKFDLPVSTTNYETPMTRSKCFDTSSLGPVIKLPVDTKIVMRLDGCSRSRPRTPDKIHIKEKIKKACCLEPACANQLAALDNLNSELKNRATKLAMREAERVRLLERAEAAWRDLEVSYQRRLTLAEEKEGEITKQINKIIEERNNFKATCLTLADNLKKKSDAAEKATANLNKIDKQVCDKACERLSLMESAMKEDANLCDAQCKAAQLDRDLQFKEEQARRKLQNLKTELDSSRTLTFEAERAMRAELTGLREQVAEVSKKLLTDDNENEIILKTLDELRTEKSEIIEDLEGCKDMCDSKMQPKINEIKAKKEQLSQLHSKILECKCQIPIDRCVEVKRTPSLAAICQCTPEDRLVSPCSCTSLRSSLLSTMLCDMFGGLQSELGNTGSEMPCQLLKCLEDKHNWDKSSSVVSNLTHFFSKLLISELDIAVANSIEKYHAKWVGASCADDMKKLIEPNKSEGWQKRAIEREALKMATHIADKMFEEKAQELAERAKAIASENEAPPCECEPTDNPDKLEKPVKPENPDKPVKPEQALYSVMVEGPTMSQVVGASSRTHWKSPNEVKNLRAEIENLKKEAIKKEDLRVMEKEIAKIIQLASVPSNCELLGNKDIKNKKEGNTKNNAGKSILRSNYPNNTNNRAAVQKKRQVEVNNRSKNDKNPTTSQGMKQPRKLGQSYAVNLCLCTPKSPKSTKKLTKRNSPENLSLKEENTLLNEANSSPKEEKKTPLKKSVVSQVSSIKQSKPISNVPTQIINITKKAKDNNSCKTNQVCFHKVPSNTSIDKLLKTLEKWQSEIVTINDLNKKHSNQNDNSDHNTSVTQVDVIMQEIIRDDSLSFSNTSEDLKFFDDSKKSSFDQDTSYNYLPAQDVPETLQKDKYHNEGDNVYPTNTESEYLGAIYLDKSNCCKCVIDGATEDSYPLKCIRSCGCPLKLLDSVKSQAKTINLPNETEKYTFPMVEHHKNNLINKAQGSQNILTKTLSKSTYIKNKDPLDVYMDINDLVSRSVQMAYSINNVEEDEKIKTPLLGSSTKTVIPDYDIEFLGVTLTNAVTKSNHENSNKKGKLSKVEYNSQEKLGIESKNYLENYADADNFKNVGIDNPDPFFVPTCKCETDIEDIKNLFSTIFSTKRDTNCDIKDQCLDTQSLKDSCRNESCICCSKTEKDKDAELELNTFILLEEHLKRKLNELKLNCRASCIPADEEEKVLSTLFKKIKQLVISSTNEVMCKCADSKEIDDSWNRALNLLQEYLNTKINRVKCLCSSPKSSKRILVPEIMDNVCKLIENDFSRLKTICRCKNLPTLNHKKKVAEQVTFQVPEKEIHIVKNEAVVSDYLLDTSNSDDDYYDPSFGLVQNVSAQVSNFFGKINKSSTTLQKEIMFTEPLQNNSGEKVKKSFLADLKIPTVKDVSVSKCNDVIKTNEINVANTNMLSTFIVNDLNIEEIKDVQSMKSECPETGAMDKISPYIGLTLDCTCGSNNLSDCVCSKSIIKKNNSAINNIWKSVISKPIKQNTSYIMKSYKGHIEPEIAKIQDVSDCSLQNESIHFCEHETSANMVPEIVLKNSTENNNRDPVDNSTNTAEGNKSILRDTIYNAASLNDPVDNSTNTAEGNKSILRDTIYNAASLNDEATTQNKYKIEMEALKSEILINNTNENWLNNSLPQICKCTKVPICHVKMLVDNIENKLSRSSCTCDSLNINVCPVHSFKTTVSK